MNRYMIKITVIKPDGRIMRERKFPLHFGADAPVFRLSDSIFRIVEVIVSDFLPSPILPLPLAPGKKPDPKEVLRLPNEKPDWLRREVWDKLREKP